MAPPGSLDHVLGKNRLLHLVCEVAKPPGQGDWAPSEQADFAPSEQAEG
jgi:hypothetical protein